MPRMSAKSTNARITTLPTVDLDYMAVYDNLALVTDAGLLRYVDLDATCAAIDGKRHSPRIPDTWSWASKI